MSRKGKDTPKREPARIAVHSIGKKKNRLALNGFLVFDDQIPSIVSHIEIYGSYQTNLRLMRFRGDLVAFQRLMPDDARTTEEGLGRFHHEGWMHFGTAEQPKLQKVGTIKVVRHAVERRLDRGGKHQPLQSYVFTVDVAGWPTAGFFGLSYEGTIERRKYRQGLNILADTREFRAEADHHYHFEKGDRSLTRRQLASITVSPKQETADVQRALDATRVCMSFLYEIELKPLQKTISKTDGYRIVSFPGGSPESVDREFYTRPIGPGDQKKVSSKIIRWLYHSGVDLDQVEHAIHRYVAASRNLPMQQAFSAGCEAIEALYSCLAGERMAFPATKEVAKRLRAIIADADIDVELKEAAKSRVDQIFSRPTWHKIRDRLSDLISFEGEDIKGLLGRANFFRYRNLSSHGQRIQLKSELFFQFEVMRLVFQILLTRSAGLHVHLPLIDQIELEDMADNAESPGLVTIWE